VLVLKLISYGYKRRMVLILKHRFLPSTSSFMRLANTM